ncbi:hypothetical protein [Belnapia moabensis]|uniref:hypothetical protein n=1 Tax=Belnapia moabensis TaxID=365533 RepID=UPI0005BE729F|nr:hypothetical protein [Belnapia moabensis]
MNVRAITHQASGIDGRIRVKTLIVAALFAAVALRVWAFATGRSLWLDEAMVALNIIHLPMSSLVGGLEFNQLAPIGWLLLEKCCLFLFEDFDYSLRLVALLSGIASVYLFYRLMRHSTGSWETLVGVTQFGISAALIQYSSMVKPYILDAAFSSAFLHISVMMLRSPAIRPQMTISYAALGLLCVPLAFGGTIVMAATGTLLFIASLANQDRRWTFSLIVVGCLWMAAFWIFYHFFYEHQENTVSNMTNVFWNDSFAPLRISLASLTWYPRAIGDAILFLVPTLGVQLLAAFFIIGCVKLASRDPWLLALILSTFLAALLVSGLRAYPFSPRFLLFLAPPLILAVSVGLVTTARSFSRPRIAALVLLLLFGGGQAVIAARSVAQLPAWPIEEIKQNLAHLAVNLRPGDEVIMNQAAERAYLLYARRYGLGGLPYKVMSDHRLDPSCIYADIRTIESARRAWVIIYHPTDREGTDLLRRTLSQSGRLQVASAPPGSTLYEYQARPEVQDRFILPAASPQCAVPREGDRFLDWVAAKNASQ